MTVPRVRRTKEEALLLVVSVAAAALTVAADVRSQSAGPALSASTAAALTLALVTAFAFWFAGAARRAVQEAEDLELEAVRQVLAAVPDGLLVIGDDLVLSVNRRFCKLLGYRRDELVGATAPFPFWPPEHRHELERWHAGRAAGRAESAELVYAARDGRRIRVLVATGVLRSHSGEPRYVLSVRDVSASHRRERRLAELATHDPATGLLNERGLEQSLRHAVGRALAAETSLSVCFVELDRDLERPETLLAVERLRALVRTGDDLGRTADGALAWILVDTDAEGAVDAVSRARRELAHVTDVTLTAGICDLAAAGDALSLYALADRALAEARLAGPGATACLPSPDDALASRLAS
jgi:PAS domain S-box-containing protein